MSMFSEGQMEWDEVRQCHDAWMEQERLELLAQDLSTHGNPNPELLKAIEQQVRALDLMPSAARAA